ncbi:MAG: carboxypeptidase regulatory-like domain-containing protein [Armatimonadetes bacterium]|nr:carboxypeptidase regulatory-like domain-containing protein [Armatimonadota bacterium]
MTEKTRVRLGAYFLFALLLLTLPVTLLVAHYDAAGKAKRWVRAADGMELVKPTDRAQAVAYAQKTYRVSHREAERILAKRERETGLRVGDTEKVPYGTQVDYYSVDGTKIPNTAKFEGAATVVNPASAVGQEYINYVRAAARRENRPEWRNTLEAMLKKDLLLVPAMWGMTPAPAAATDIAKANLKAAVQNKRIAVICTKLPGLRDISPRSDGDTSANDNQPMFIDYDNRVSNPTAAATEICYRAVAPDATLAGLVYNYATTSDNPAGGDEDYSDQPYGPEFGSIFDSPGGCFSSSNGTWGVPRGIVDSPWDFTDIQREPHSSRATNVMLQNSMYDLFFNTSFSKASVSNWFYQQTHGRLHVDGNANDVIGWLTSAHQLNRYPYQIGSGNQLFVYPGTPVIRRVSAAGVDPDTPGVNQIVRATLSSRGLTILFNKPLQLSLGNLRLTVYTNSLVTTGVTGTAPNRTYTTATGGYVSINFSLGSPTVTMDPYDARRWTIQNDAFTYQYYSGTYAADGTPTTNTLAWVPRNSGDNWNMAYGVFTGVGMGTMTATQIGLDGTPAYVNQDQSTVHGGLNRGCPQLANTAITDADMRISLYDHSDLDYKPAGVTSTEFPDRPFARLKSEEWYINSFHAGDTYQITHMRNEWGAEDDISGTTVPNDENHRWPRMYPYDHEDDDPWNGGYWPTGAPPAPAGREGSSGAYAGDVNKVLEDNGLWPLINYDTRIYIAADGGTSEPGGSELGNESGFQPSSSLDNFNESGAGVAFHELSHAWIGAVDLYDNDVYNNGLSVPPPVPLYSMCYAMGKYSIMAAGGRLDAYHLTKNPNAADPICVPQVIIADTLGVQVPEIESLLRDPVILKIPGNPYYLKKSVASSTWKEYFLVENRNVNSGDGNGAYGFDSSDKGMYIYHIDGRGPVNAMAGWTDGGIALNNASQAGSQRDDNVLTVIIEQADGKYELEYDANGGIFTSDPFGCNTATRVDRFWQFPMMNGDVNHLTGLVANVHTIAGSPTSYSHGQIGADSVLLPGTATDSFARIVNISNSGQTMTADIYVEPAELRVTGTSLAPASVQQGQEDVGMLLVTMENRQDTTVGKTDMSRMSTKDVYVDTLRILESGTSSEGGNIETVKLYEDDGNGVLDVPGDALLATGVVNDTPGQWDDYAEFTNLGYKVPLNGTRKLIIAYDIAPEAQNNPHVTVGAEFTDAAKILPRLPGTVEVRQRLDANPNSDNAADMYNFGSYMFPVFSNTAVIVGYPDRLVVTGDTTNLPTKVSQGQAELPMLKLNCAVNPNSDPRAEGSVRVDSVKVDQIGTVNALSDLVNCKLYLDANGDGVFDAANDTVLGTSSFTLVGALHQANFPNLNLTFTAGAPRALFLAVSVAATADTTKNIKLSVKFNTPGPQPQNDPVDGCYIQLINNTSEPDVNKDFVEYQAVDSVVWPIDSEEVSVILPNQPPTAPVAPFSPSGGQQISNQSPILSWGAGADPDATDTPDTLHYEVQIADNAGFSAPQSKITAENVTQWDLSQAPAVVLNLNQQYWWRARTVDRQDATSNWCATQTFNVVDNRAPVVIAGGFQVDGVAVNPGTTLDITSTTPTLTWNKTTDPDTAPADPDTTLRYLLQVDDNQDFSSPVTLTNVGGVAPQWASFGPCPDPAVGGNQNAGLSNADQNTYGVVVGDGLTKATTYYWRVAAVDGANAECDWTAWLAFRPTDNHAPNMPVAPFVYTGGAEVTSANPVLSWAMPATPDPDPTDTLPTIRYDLEMKLGDGDLTNGTIISHTTAQDVRQWAVGVALTDNGHYYWHVRSLDDQGLYSSWSAVQDFWVNTTNDPPTAPTTGWDLPDGATTNDTTPTLSWDNSVDPDVDPYDGAFSGAGVVGVSWVVQLSQSQTFATVPYTYSTGPLGAAGRPSVTATTPLTENVWWYWRVRAVDNDGAQSVAWSTTQRFMVNSLANAPTAPNSGFVPANGGTVGAVTSITLRWNPGTDTEDAAAALRYEVEVADNAALATAPGYYYYSGTSAPGQNYRTLPPTPLTVGTTYYWHVRTVDTTGLRSPWSGLLNFTVGANRPPNNITAGFYPTGTQEITDQTPALRWSAANPPDPDADDIAETMGYLVEVDDNPGFVNPEFSTTLLPPHAVPTTPTVTVTTPLVVGTRYYWRVRPVDRKGTQSAAWSASQDFRVAVNHAPSAPIGAFTPPNDLGTPNPLNTANPTLAWNMPTPPDPDTSDTIDTIRYEVQLSDQPDLASGPYTYTVVTAPNTMQTVCTTNLLDNEQYWWRVRAMDGQGATSDWSSTQTFWINLSNQAPLAPDAGFVPANGVQVSDSTPDMSWNPAYDEDPDDPAGTLHYIVELSTSDTFATVSYQYTTGNGVTTVTPTSALTDLTTWYWRVRTVDDSGAQSPWSAVQNFYLDEGNQTPTLDNAQVNPLYGALGTYYELSVTYTDAENDQPDWVRCTFDNGVGPLDMQKVTPGDTNATNGIQYIVGIQGSVLGLGAHQHAFSCQSGMAQVRLPATPTDYLRGPIIGVQSTVRFTDAAALDATEYEEGSLIWIELVDADENNDPGAPDTVSVTVTEQGGDSEDVQLVETGNATGTFRGSLPSLGRAGAVNDGALNAIAGAAGNDIAVSYRDPDDLADNPAPDTSTDAARIVDTTPPDTVGGGPAVAAVQGVLGLSSGPHGRTVNLDWSSYPEAAQVDVAGYHVWASETDFNSTVGLTFLATVPAGTQTYTATQLPSGTILDPNTQYWFAVTAFDEVPLEDTTVDSRAVTTHDTTPPLISAHNPPPGTTEVALATTISFNLDDQGVGIDQSTLVVTLTQNGGVVPHNMPLTTTGDDASLQVTVVPTQPFLWNATINVGVVVEDHDNNQLTVADWEFDTVTDHVLPTLDSQSPAPDATNVPVGTTISFALHDTGSGINQAATVLIFDGQDVSASLTYAALSDGWRVTYDPPADLAYNRQYAVSASGADIAGNPVGPVNWQFNTVVDSGSVTVDQQVPAPNATDVPVDTNVSFRLSDTLSGIVEADFRLWVNNTEVTGTPELTIIKVPAGSATPNTMAVSYNPPANFNYSTDIPVRIYAEDSVGNVTDTTYSFRTADAPTYNVSGIIATADGTPIPGVTVTAGGQTAQSDGNGAYRITGLLAGDYTVTPTRDQYVFTPTNAQVTLGPDDAIANFTGQLLTYALSGTITEAGEGLEGVQVACNGQTATTDAQGRYTITGLPNGQYTVTPTLLNYHFQPPTRAAQVDGANVTGVDFEGIADTFTVAGTITDNTGTRVEGARVECGGKSAVTNAAGQYLITGLRAGTYTVTPTKPGYLMDPLTRNVTVPPSRTAQDFTANIEMVSGFPAGLNFIGVPGTPIDPNPMNVFGVNPLQNENCFRWSPAAVPPRYLVAQNDPGAEAIQVKPGRGFFVTFQQARELRVAGVPTSALGTTSIGLYEGWNMIANPRSTPLKFSNFVPNIAGGIRSFAYVYDNALGSYLMVSSDPGLGATRDTILGWEGAWVRATGGGVSLLVSGPAVAATPSAMRPQQADLNGGWTIPVVARAGNRSDVSSLAGMVPGAGAIHTIENPPTAPDTVDVYFTDETGTRLAHDVRSTTGAQTFRFVVACEVPDADVTITLPDLSSVPADLQVMLLDKETGKSQYARTMQSYTYHSAGAGNERSFELSVSPRTIGALSLSATASQARGGNVMLSYTVTRACNVSVKVMNVAGRCIRDLVADRPVAAGVQSELWNLCSASGTRVPAGMYLLQIEAVTDTGQRVRGMAQVRVTR